ncbi:hypothetical protein Peur_032906 [Populus x canadensis]
MKGRGWSWSRLHLGQSRHGAAKNGSQTKPASVYDKVFDTHTHVDLQGCWLSFLSYGLGYLLMFFLQL